MRTGSCKWPGFARTDFRSSTPVVIALVLNTVTDDSLKYSSENKNYLELIRIKFRFMFYKRFSLVCKAYMMMRDYKKLIFTASQKERISILQLLDVKENQIVLYSFSFKYLVKNLVM